MTQKGLQNAADGGARRVCRACKKSNDMGAKTCAHCGAPLNKRARRKDRGADDTPRLWRR